MERISTVYSPTTCPTDATKTPESKTHNACAFGRRVISAILVVVPHMVMHTALSAASGFAIATSTPITRFGQLGADLGGDNRIASTICHGIGCFAGFFVSVVAALPGLLIGTVAGVGAGIYQLPAALSKSYDAGILPALKEGYELYDIGQKKKGNCHRNRSRHVTCCIKLHPVGRHGWRSPSGRPRGNIRSPCLSGQPDNTHVCFYAH